MGFEEFLAQLRQERDRVIRALKDSNLDPAQPAWSSCLLEGQTQKVIERLRMEDEYAFSAAEWKGGESTLYLDLVSINAHMIMLLLSGSELGGG
jgi:hypothetical protein